MKKLSICFIVLLLVCIVSCSHICKIFGTCEDPDPTPGPTKTYTPILMPTPTPTPWTPKTVLTAQGRDFAINGVKTFIVMVSYYGGNIVEYERFTADMDWLRSKGFNAIRYWIPWNRCSQNASVFDLHSQWIPERVAALDLHLRYCDKIGMIVDLSNHYCNKDFYNECCNASDERTCDQPFHDGCERPSEPSRTIAAHRSECENMAKFLRNSGYKNIMMDICNECTITDMRHIEKEEVRSIVTAIKSIYPSLIVTASGNLPEVTLFENVDYMAPHLARGDDPWLYTCPWLCSIQPFNLPVMLQEPFRNGYGGDQYEYWEFGEDLSRSIMCQNPAAGWCFHTDAGFYLYEQDFRTALDDQEMLFINHLRDYLPGGNPRSGLPLFNPISDVIPDFGPYYDGPFLKMKP